MRVFVGRVLGTSINCTVTEARDGQDAIDQCGKSDPELGAEPPLDGMHVANRQLDVVTAGDLDGGAVRW